MNIIFGFHFHLILRLGVRYEITISCFSAYLIALLTNILLKTSLEMLLMSISISWIYFKLQSLTLNTGRTLSNIEMFCILRLQTDLPDIVHQVDVFTLNQICLISCWRQMTGIYRHVTVKPKSFENIQTQS